MPLLVFLQGIPALSWVIIAIIWFHGTSFASSSSW